jgi:hypothetical protein
MTEANEAEEMAHNVEEFYRGEKPPLPTGVRSPNITKQGGPVDDDAQEYRVIFNGSNLDYTLTAPDLNGLGLSSHGGGDPAYIAREMIAKKLGLPVRKVRVALEHSHIRGQDF